MILPSLLVVVVVDDILLEFNNKLKKKWRRGNIKIKEDSRQAQNTKTLLLLLSGQVHYKNQQ